MADINDLVQETPSDRAVEPYGAMRCLLEILQKCFHFLEVCFDIISVFATAVNFADEILPQFARISTPIPPKKKVMSLPFLNTKSRHGDYSAQLDEIEVRAKFRILLDGYRKMFDQSFRWHWLETTTML